MAYALDLAVRLLVLAGFVIGGLGMYYQAALIARWQIEKRRKWWQPPSWGLLFRSDLPESCRLPRRRLVQSMVAFLVVWLLGVATIALCHALGVYPVTAGP